MNVHQTIQNKNDLFLYSSLSEERRKRYAVSTQVNVGTDVKFIVDVVNNGDDELYIDLLQLDDTNEWTKIASIIVVRETQIELEATTSSSASLSNSALKVQFRSVHGQFDIISIGYIRKDILAGTTTEIICSHDDDFDDDYRFGFDGQEKVNEIAGIGNHNTAEYWEYDTRLGRRWNLDPVDQVSVSNYTINKLNPIVISDPYR